MYDFGDEWLHELVVQASLPVHPEAPDVPDCVSCTRASPPEDCGGVPGYEDALFHAFLSGPEHPVGQMPHAFILGTTLELLVCLGYHPVFRKYSFHLPPLLASVFQQFYPLLQPGFARRRLRQLHIVNL
jgi:hypothetical protein